MYVCLAGAHPFAGSQGRDELASLQRRVVPAPLRSASIPVALADLIAAALEKEPTRRPKSAFALAQKLRDVRAQLRAPEARLQLVRQARSQGRPGTTDRLLRDLRGREPSEAKTLVEEREATTQAWLPEPTTTLVDTQPTPPPPQRTAVLVAPWLPKSMATPVARRRPGRPAPPAAAPTPSPPQGRASATMSAPRVLVPLEGETSNVAHVLMDLSDSCPAESLISLQTTRASAIPFPPQRQIIAFLVFCFVLGALLTLWLTLVI